MRKTSLEFPDFIDPEQFKGTARFQMCLLYNQNFKKDGYDKMTGGIRKFIQMVKLKTGSKASIVGLSSSFYGGLIRSYEIPSRAKGKVKTPKPEPITKPKKIKAKRERNPKNTIYLNNKTLFEALKNSHIHGHKISNELAEFFLLMTRRFFKSQNWSGYPFVEEMENDAILKLVEVWDHYDLSKDPPNPFSYYTQIIKNCAIHRYNTEKKKHFSHCIPMDDPTFFEHESQHETMNIFNHEWH